MRAEPKANTRGLPTLLPQGRMALTPSTEASAKREPHRALFRFAVVAQAVLAEACSRKEFFDELADNLEARSHRYTHQSGPGIITPF